MNKKLFIVPLICVMMAGCGTKTTTTNEEAQKTGENKPLEQVQTPESETQENQNLQTEATTTSPVETASSTIINNNEENKMVNIKEVNQVLMKTSLGDIKIELDWKNAPISTENFLTYVQQGFYDGTIFHRVMKGFMIQGGGFDASGNQKTTNAEIKNEAKNGLKNNRGTLAMARTMVVDSASSQFFINLVDNDFLNYRDDQNYGYAVFGKVVDGMEIVDTIAQVRTGNNGQHQNWPMENVSIKSVEFVK